MPKFEVKLPKKISGISVIRADSVIRREKEKLRREEEKRLAEERRIREEQERIEAEKAAEEAEKNRIKDTYRYYQEITFSRANQPLQIDIPEDLLIEKVPLTDAEEQVEKAYAKGYEEGSEETAAIWQKQVTELQDWIRRVDKVVDKLKSDYNKSIADFRDTLVKLSIMTAEHVLRHEITKNSELVIDQVKKTVDSLDNEQIFKIRLNPDDVDILEQIKSRLVSDSTRIEGAVIAPDSSISRGGCILETSSGQIDSRVETQLEILKEKLDEIAIQPPNLPLNSTDDILPDTDDPKDENLLNSTGDNDVRE